MQEIEKPAILSAMSDSSDILNTEEEFSKKLDLKLWSEIFYFVKPFKFYIITLIAVNVIQSTVINVFPLLVKNILDSFSHGKNIQLLLNFAVYFFALVFFNALLTYITFIITGKFETKVKYKLRKACFDKLQVLNISYYDKTKAGWILSRVGQDAQVFMEIFAWTIADLSYGIFVFIFFIITMLVLQWKIALLSFIVLPIIATLSFYFHKRLIQVQRKIKKTNSTITAAYNEDIQGAKTTKVFVREEQNTEDFSVHAENLRKHKTHSAGLTAVFIPLISFLGCISAMIVLNLGGKQLLLGSMSVGTFYVLLYYALQIYEPVRSAAALFSDILSGQASAERIFSLINEQVHENNTDNDTAEKSNETEQAEKIIGNVEFRNVSFTYKGTTKPVIKNFNLTVKAGQQIALVGETGSGKSTIVNLLCRFYEPSEGSILIDGIDYTKKPENWLRCSLGYVLQSPQLFSGTVAENVRYGKPEASPEEVVAACKKANAHRFVTKLVNGYNTELGEGASKISIGQKQLLSIARAIIRDPRLIVLDEATSSVDTETEYEIQQSLHECLKGRTSFVVAHRLSTVRHANLILVIHAGEVLEQGTHAELMKKRGAYYNLYVKQFLERLDSPAK